MSNQTRIEWKQIGPTVYSAKFSRFTLEAWYDRHRGWRWWVVGNRNTRIDEGFAPRPSAARTAAEEALSEFIQKTTPERLAAHQEATAKNIAKRRAARK